MLNAKNHTPFRETEEFFSKSYLKRSYQNRSLRVAIFDERHPLVFDRWGYTYVGYQNRRPGIVDDRISTLLTFISLAQRPGAQRPTTVPALDCSCRTTAKLCSLCEEHVNVINTDLPYTALTLTLRGAGQLPVNFIWVHPLGQPPGLAQKTCPGGRDLIFLKLPRGREFDKGRDYVENEVETSKNSLDQFFTGIKKQKTKSRISDLFRGFVSFNRNFPGLWVNVLVLLSLISLQKI